MATSTNQKILAFLEAQDARLSKLEQLIDSVPAPAQPAQPAQPAANGSADKPTADNKPTASATTSARRQARASAKQAATPADDDLIPNYLRPVKRHNTYEPANLPSATELVWYRIHDGGKRASLIFNGAPNSAYALASMYGIPTKDVASSVYCAAVYAAVGAKFARNRSAEVVESASMGEVRCVVKVTPVHDGETLTDAIVNNVVHNLLRTK